MYIVTTFKTVIIGLHLVWWLMTKWKRIKTESLDIMHTEIQHLYVLKYIFLLRYEVGFFGSNLKIERI